MRQKMENNVSVQIRGADLSEYTDLKCFIKQSDRTFSFECTVDEESVDTLNIIIPKGKTMYWNPGRAKLQIAMTSPEGKKVSHDPIDINIGEMLWGDGYGE